MGSKLRVLTRVDKQGNPDLGFRAGVEISQVKHKGKSSTEPGKSLEP